jgi:hypothetical protein
MNLFVFSWTTAVFKIVCCSCSTTADTVTVLSIETVSIDTQNLSGEKIRRVLLISCQLIVIVPVVMLERVTFSLF